MVKPGSSESSIMAQVGNRGYRILQCLVIVLISLIITAGMCYAAPDGDFTAKGRSDISDALQCLRMAVGLVQPTDLDIVHGDVAPLDTVTWQPKGDGILDESDALEILRHVINLDSWIPITAYLVPNLNVSAAAIVKLNDGTNITINGNKNADGSVNSITSIAIDSYDSNHDNTVNIDIDSFGKPSIAKIAGGGSIGFNFISNSEIDLLISNADSLTTWLVTYDPTNQVVVSINPQSANPSVHLNSIKKISQLSSSNTLGPIQGQVILSCGEGKPISADWIDSIFSYSSNTTTLGSGDLHLPVNATGTIGTYALPLPNDDLFPADITTLEKMANAIDNNLGAICGNLDLVGKLGFDKILAQFTESLLVGGKLLSAVGNVITAVCAVPTVVDKNKLLLDWASTTGSVTVYARKGSQNIESAPIPFTANIRLTPPTISLKLPSCVDHLAINSTSTNVLAGNTLLLSATAYDYNNQEIQLPMSSFKWSLVLSDDSKYASVDSSSGVVTGVSNGSVLIRVTEIVSGISKIVVIKIMSPIIGSWNGYYTQYIEPPIGEYQWGIFLNIFAEDNGNLIGNGSCVFMAPMTGTITGNLINFAGSYTEAGITYTNCTYNLTLISENTLDGTININAPGGLGGTFPVHLTK